MIDFASAMAALPLVAILRGIRPEEVENAGEALVEAGFRLIEVPLNSPDPLNSIERLAKRVGGKAIVGAGTVLTAAQVALVHDAGGTMIVSPNTDMDVIGETVARKMVSLPGYFTPSEAFAALAAGATGLKLFPAEAAGPAVIKAQRAVLPNDTPLLVVGGITPDNMDAWRQAGADGFGLGSALYRVGATTSEISGAARAFAHSWTQMQAAA